MTPTALQLNPSGPIAKVFLNNPSPGIGIQYINPKHVTRIVPDDLGPNRVGEETHSTVYLLDGRIVILGQKAKDLIKLFGFIEVASSDA